jgi:transcriptional regulator with XRE-family HTH domain
VVANQARPRPAIEEVFVEQIKARRLGKGWTQTDLARMMKERGFGFHQQTIQRIEDLQRPVRLEEAYAFASVFGTDVSSMARSQQGMRRYEVVELLMALYNVPTELTRARMRFFKELLPAVGHVDYLLTHEPSSPRIAAGAELARRAVKVLEDQIATAYERAEAAGPALESLDPDTFGADVAEGEDDIFDSEDERYIRSVLERAPVSPPRYRKMTLLELAEVYAPSTGDDDG